MKEAYLFTLEEEIIGAITLHDGTVPASFLVNNELMFVRNYEEVFPTVTFIYVS